MQLSNEVFPFLHKGRYSKNYICLLSKRLNKYVRILLIKSLQEFRIICNLVRKEC